MLYGTVPGLDFMTGISYPELAGLYSIDTDTNTVTRLYAGNETTWSGDYVFQPNGCTVKDDIVYMVETQAARTGSLGTYDIDSGNMSYSTDQLSVSGDGLVSTSDYLFMTYWVFYPSVGELMALDLNDDSAVFEILVDNMTSPADICVNEDEGMIAIPSLLTGHIYFVEYDHDDDDSFAMEHSIVAVMAVMVVSVMNVW